MLETLLANFAGMVWYYPVVYLCLISGIFFTLRFFFIQIRCLPHAIQLLRGKYDDPNEKGQITHFQALSSALSGTIGLGNIAGVAIAIGMGGPGAIFWMWIVGFFGMATKFVECTLGTHYRHIDPKTGEVRGGAMYYITKGLGAQWKPLASIFAFCVMVAAVGSGGMFQSNQAAQALYEYYHIPTGVTGFVLFLLGAIVIIGGITRIGKVTSKIVPLMCLVYVLGALVICVLNYEKLPLVLGLIISDAFTGQAAAGGSMGAVLIWGVRRAIFSNEAGLGSAPIAHAAVKTDYPIREGIVASLGPFVDTIIVCTATAIVIVLSGNFGNEMYRAVGQSPINFSNPAQLELSGAWTVTDERVPENVDPIRRFRSGDQVLKIDTTQAQQETATLAPITIPFNVTDGIRFSYFRQSGNMAINLYSGDKTFLGKLHLSAYEDRITTISPEGEVQELAAIKGYQQLKRWDSALITVSPQLFESLEPGTESADLILEFIPDSSDAAWYFDRIQTVNQLSGIELTTASFDYFFKGFGSVFITFSVFFFAFSTILTWSYYGETCAGYLFGKGSIQIYKWLFLALTMVGANYSLSMVLNFADGMLGLVVIPNTIAIFLLSPKVSRWSRDYFHKLKTGVIKPHR